MTKILEINEKEIKTVDNWCQKCSFEIVKKIPEGYFVWNIGENMGIDNYIPIATKKYPGNKDCYEIEPNTLKAIELDPEEVKILRNAAGYGVIDYKSAKKSANRKNTKSYLMRRKKEYAEKAIGIFERITA